MTHYTQLQAGRLVDENLRLRRELDAVKKERDEWRRRAEAMVAVQACDKPCISPIEETMG